MTGLAPAVALAMATLAAAPAERPEIVLLTAPWCQWCGVLEHEVLDDPTVAAAIERDFRPLRTIDIDRDPSWMDRDDVVGLPSLLFFDSAGRHVLTKSGYRPVPKLLLLLDAVVAELGTGRLTPYAAREPGLTLPAAPLSPADAAAALARLEKQLFFKVSSNDGGFRSPTRHPQPLVLLALQRWLDEPDASPPERVERWIALTMKSALMGSSPRLLGEPLPDLQWDARSLKAIAGTGPDFGPDWRLGIERLPEQDPYRGLQDPIDGGVFRYASGPGWYNPHFERSAADNLAWSALLKRRGDDERAAKILRFVEATFADGSLLRTTQRSDPFYYRLTEAERRGAKAPPVDPLLTLGVQALAAHASPARCLRLEPIDPTSWPRAHWTEGRLDPASRPATVDEVGELLLALATCRSPHAAPLADVVVRRWETEALPAAGIRRTRLNRLAAGLCAAGSPACGRALAAIAPLKADLDFAPPLTALAIHASSAP